MRGAVLDGTTLRRGSAFVDDEHAEVVHQLVGAQVDVAVVHGGDGDDVGFPDFVEEIGDDFFESIVADFEAVGAADAADPDELLAWRGLLGGGEGLGGFLNEDFGGGFVDGYGEMTFLAHGGGGGDRIGILEGWMGVGRNLDVVVTGGTGDV